ncbi:hypothetical protein PG996_007219 [Apiospora saccharicola]|uniref:NAD(P)-binding protein n=1 Tax=Apiospora saccharicola TaxID=335842 RepID=A0ABR1VB30_9PEZI
MVRYLSKHADNTIVRLVRNKAATEQKVAEELKDDAPAKIHIVAADMDSYDSLKNAAAETSFLTGGAIDYLIANAAYVPVGKEFFKPIGDVATDPEKLEADLNKMIKTNVTGNIFLYSLFMPLILMSQTKKVICITSGLAEVDTCNSSKAAMNLATCKFNAQYKKDGVLFIDICPGMVDHGNGIDPATCTYTLNEYCPPLLPASLTKITVTPEEMAQAGELMGKFAANFPDFKGPSQSADTIPAIVKTWEDASLEKGHGGGFLPHTGIPGKWL